MAHFATVRDTPAPTIIGWTVTTDAPMHEEPLICGFFLTSAEALHASLDLAETARRMPERPHFEVVPVYAAEPINLLRVVYDPAARTCRVGGCHATVGQDGFDGYCVDCADELFGLPPARIWSSA